MSKYLFMDIEAPGLLPWELKEIFCLYLEDEYGNGDLITNIQESKSKLEEFIWNAEKIILHNGVMYDIPALLHVWGINIPLNKVFDTLLISRLLQPDREGGHSLKAWGQRVGSNKIEFTEFTKLTKEMIEYCKQDVKVTKLIYNALQKELDDYEIKGDAIEIEHQFAYLIQKQIQTGFTLDTEKAEKLYQNLSKEYKDIYDELLAEMPKIKLKTEAYKKGVLEGRLLRQTDKDFTYINGRGKIITKEFKYELANPTSRQQFAKHLQTEYQWIPTIFTETGQPQISESILEPLPYIFAKKGAKLFRLQKQLGMLKDGDYGWLKLVKEDGRVHGDVITNGANTGRCTHSKPNIAQVDSDPKMREVWIPKYGWKLVDVDASSLELRILAHYLYPYDGGVFASEVINGDIHTYNQQIAGLNDRNSAKTLIYALVYGAGNAKLGKIKSLDSHQDTTNIALLISKGNELRDTIEDNFTGYKDLLANVQKAFKIRGYLKGLDGRPLHPRTDYSALNLLIQSAGAIIMKKALINSFKLLNCKNFKISVDYNIVANIHDEIILESKPELAEEIKQICIQAIRQVTTDFNLKVQLDGDGKIGTNWSEVH